MNARILYVALFSLGLAAPLHAAETFSVLVFNAWGAGLNEGKPIDETLAVLRTADADIIALNEPRAESDTCTAEYCPAQEKSVAPDLANALGYRYVEQHGPEQITWAAAILSRYPIIQTTPGPLGAIIDVDGRHVAVFNIHPSDFPYQPYQLLNIPYGDAPFLDNADQAIEAARAARGGGFDFLEEQLAGLPAVEAELIGGDFNEPSHLDWTPRAVEAGLHPLAVEFPASKRLASWGFRDAYRTIFPDEVAHPGLTWTPFTAPDDPADHHDRIDRLYYRGSIVVENVAIIGENSQYADIVVEPYPSDHRALLVRLRLE